MPQATPETCDVLIIGAGLAGLSAAKRLSQEEKHTVVLEASDRLGGRTHGEFWPEASRAVDLGGTWLLPSFSHTYALLEEFGIDTVDSPVAEKSLTHFSQGVRQEVTLSPEEADALWAGTERMRAAIGEHAEVSAAEALSAEAFPPRLLNWHVATQRYLVGAPLTDFDAGHLFLERSELLDPDHYHAQIVGTTRSLVDALAESARADIRMNTKGTEISQADDRFAVRTADGLEFLASQVIVAAPRNTLADIAIDPAPTGALAELIAHPHVGASRKDWFVLDGVEEHLRLFASEGPFGYFLTEERLADGGMLAVGLAPEAEGFPTVEEFEAALQAYAPGCRVRAHLRYDWSGEEHARGTWLGPLLGDYRRNAEIASPLPGLFFVGSDFSVDMPGTIEGAIRTGFTAAAQCCDAGA